MSMTPEQIRAAIAASPELQALAAPGVRNDGEIARLLSLSRPPVVVSKIITARGIAAAYPDGPVAAEAVLLKLEGARDAMLQAPAGSATFVTGSLLRRQLTFLATEGLDFGDPALRAMLDAFSTQQGGNAITTAEAGKLKGMAQAPAPAVSVDAVSAALNAGA